MAIDVLVKEFNIAPGLDDATSRACYGYRVAIDVADVNVRRAADAAFDFAVRFGVGLADINSSGPLRGKGPAC